MEKKERIVLTGLLFMPPPRSPSFLSPLRPFCPSPSKICIRDFNHAWTEDFVRLGPSPLASLRRAVRRKSLISLICLG